MSDYKLLRGDCLKKLLDLPDNSIDAVVTDPPYGLSKEPDMTEVLRHWLAGDDYQHKGKGFMGKSWDSFVPGPAVWRECLRVLKPGGHLVSFFGTRTYDMGVLAIRLAGFEIRDQLAWVYGSGFPKSQNVSKAIDKAAGAERQEVGRKNVGRGNQRGEGFRHAGSGDGVPVTAPATPEAEQWDGWGTALKPAQEPIVLARKPLTGTVAANVLDHGTGALNIDGCRVPTEEGGRPKREVAAMREDVEYGGNALAGRVDGSLQSSKAVGSTDQGRWPANLVHDGSDEVLAAFPDAPGQQRSVGPEHGDKPSINVYGDYGARDTFNPRGDKGSAARFFYCAKASKRDRNEGLENLPDAILARSCQAQAEAKRGNTVEVEGGAYNKARVTKNNHPTVKPTALMRWLVRLVTPPGGTVLDPYTGSGSTGKASILEGFQFVGIERDADERGEPLGYIDIAHARIGWAIKQVETELSPRPESGPLNDPVDPETSGQIALFDAPTGSITEPSDLEVDHGE